MPRKQGRSSMLNSMRAYGLSVIAGGNITAVDPTADMASMATSTTDAVGGTVWTSAITAASGENEFAGGQSGAKNTSVGSTLFVFALAVVSKITNAGTVTVRSRKGNSGGPALSGTLLASTTTASISASNYALVTVKAAVTGQQLVNDHFDGSIQTSTDTVKWIASGAYLEEFKPQ